MASILSFNDSYQIQTIYMVKNRCALCTQPYPGRPKGCPNFGKRAACPPIVPLIQEFFDTAQPLYLLYTKWEIGKWAHLMRARHLGWTIRQLYNCLYWQGQVRKILKDYAVEWMNLHPRYTVHFCPEGMGLDVDKVIRESAGVQLEWPPREWVVKVAVAGVPRKI